MRVLSCAKVLEVFFRQDLKGVQGCRWFYCRLFLRGFMEPYSFERDVKGLEKGFKAGPWTLATGGGLTAC